MLLIVQIKAEIHIPSIYVISERFERFSQVNSDHYNVLPRSKNRRRCSLVFSLYCHEIESDISNRIRFCRYSSRYGGLRSRQITNEEALSFSFFSIASASILVIKAYGSSVVLASCLPTVERLSALDVMETPWFWFLVSLQFV